MPLHLPTLLTRTGSAIVFGIVMLAGLLGPDWLYLGLIGLIMLLCLREFFPLSARMDGAAQPAGIRTWTYIAAAFAFALGVAFFESRLWHAQHPADSPRSETRDLATMRFGLLAAPLFLAALVLLIRALRSRLSPFSTRPFFALGYITLPCLALVGLRLQESSLPLVLICFIWSNDTLAYLVGSLIGKTPFSPISPKKTWEGTAGGALLTLLGAAIAGWAVPGASPKIYLGLAVCATVFGTLGDLFESKLKRLAGVKDSGAIMPGHGGALDRFDSLLVAAPFALCWVQLAAFF